jgi:hypothetical protein
MPKLLTMTMAALFLVAAAAPGARAEERGFHGGGGEMRFRGGEHERDRDGDRDFHNRFFFGGGAFYGGAPYYPYYPYYPQTAWYCANPAGYYPYVPRCAVAWQAVPVQ